LAGHKASRSPRGKRSKKAKGKAVDLDRVIELARHLPREEQERLRGLLNHWLSVPVRAPTALTEDEVEAKLLAEGILDYVPPPIKDLSAFKGRKLVRVQGKPLSETIVEERR